MREPAELSCSRAVLMSNRTSSATKCSRVTKAAGTCTCPHRTTTARRQHPPAHARPGCCCASSWPAQRPPAPAMLGPPRLAALRGAGKQRGEDARVNRQRRSGHPAAPPQHPCERPEASRQCCSAPAAHPAPRRAPPGPWRPWAGAYCLSLSAGAEQQLRLLCDTDGAGRAGRHAAATRARQRARAPLKPGLPSGVPVVLRLSAAQAGDGAARRSGNGDMWGAAEPRWRGATGALRWGLMPPP